MSTVKIIKSTFSRSTSTITGEVIIEVAFNESETRLDVGFVPTIFLIPTVASTHPVQVGTSGWPAPMPVYLDIYRKEASVSTFSVIRPSGVKTVALTFTVDVAKLFDKGMETFFSSETGALDVRAEIKPEIVASGGSLGNQLISPTAQALASTAVQFDGVENYIEFSRDRDLPFTTHVTVEMWMRGVPKEAFLFFLTNGNNKPRLLGAHVPYSDNNVYFDGGWDGANFDRICKNLSPADDKDTWNHWAFVRDAVAGRMSIYRNGVLWHEQQTGLLRSMTGCRRIVVGADGEYNWRHSGAITEFRLWSCIRTETEIRENMKRRVPVGQYLGIAYSLREASTSVPDWAGNGCTGTMHGPLVTVPGPVGLVG